MALSDSIKVRLREGQAQVYAAEAERRGVGIATVIRDRLERAEQAAEELSSIRAALDELGDAVDELRQERAIGRADDAVSGTSDAATDAAIQIETLLLLRAIAPPAKMQIVRGELDRQGITPWSGSEDGNAPRR